MHSCLQSGKAGPGGTDIDNTPIPVITYGITLYFGEIDCSIILYKNVYVYISLPALFKCLIPCAVTYNIVLSVLDFI